MNKRRIVLGLALALLLAIGGGTAVALNGENSKVATPVDVNPPMPADAFSETFKQALSATQAPAAPIDTVDGLALLRGANPAEARVARRDGAGAVYLLPAADGWLCVSSTSGLEAGCYDADTTVTAASVICAPNLPANTVEVFGIAEDGIDSVTIARADGSTVEVAVEGNVYIYRAPREEPRPLTVAWEGSSGSGEVSANVPEDFREGICATPADAAKQGLRRVDPDEPTRLVGP